MTLATGRTLSRTTVPAWLAGVKREVGGFRLRIITGSIHDGATALEQGGADFLLSFTHPRLPLLLDEQRFEGLTLGTDELVAVSAPRPDGRPLHALPGTARKPVPALLYAPTLALNQILQDGLSRLPRGLVGGDLKSGRLAAADARSPAMRFEIRLYRPRHARSDLAQRIWAASQSA